MKIHAFVAPADLASKLASAGVGDVISIYEETLIRQWASVLRFEAGERVLMYFGDDSEAECVVETLSRKEISVRVERTDRNAAAAALADRPIRAYVALLKGDSFEWAAQKLAEIGVATLVPVIADRCVKRSANVERLRAIAREAAEQSMNARVMEVAEPVPFDQAVAGASASCPGGFVAAHVDSLSADGTASATASAPLDGAWRSGPDVRGFIVGPEGGFTDAEVSRLREAGGRFMSLGPTVLRAETAAIACALAARDANRG